MTDTIDIRSSTSDDTEAIVSMYPRAFPDEDLVHVVRKLLAAPDVAMSLVATVNNRIVGHVVFTACAVEHRNLNASLLAPLAVEPDCQRQGIGTAIVNAGLERLRQTGVDAVFVLGDPAYYSRLGFEPDTRVQPPYPLPAEWYSAWQSKYLVDAASAGTGKLAVPSQWRDPALWAP